MRPLPPAQCKADPYLIIAIYLQDEDAPVSGSKLFHRPRLPETTQITLSDARRSCPQGLCKPLRILTVSQTKWKRARREILLRTTEWSDFPSEEAKARV